MGNGIRKQPRRAFLATSESRSVIKTIINRHDSFREMVEKAKEHTDTTISGWHPAKYGQPLKPDKGLYNGSCNREACQDPGAVWYNHGTRKYYCAGCAKTLNEDPFNRSDAHRSYGHDLCTLGENKIS